MTLRIQVSIVPFGDETKKREILTLNISNVTHKDGRGPNGEDTYIIEKNDYKNYTDQTPRLHHHRDDGFEALVIAALEKVR